MSGRDPFAPPAGTTTKYVGRGRLDGPRVTTPKQVGTGGLGVAGHGRSSGTLSWIWVPGFPSFSYINAVLPPGIQTYDAVLAVGRNLTPFTDPLAQLDWDGFELDNAYTTRASDGRFVAWASIGLGVLLAAGNPLGIGGRYVDTTTPGEGDYAVVAFHTAWRNIPFVGPDAAAGFAGQGFWQGDFLGPVTPSWTWDVPGPNGLSQPYFDGSVGGQPYAPAPGYARVIAAFTDTTAGNYLAGPTHDGWAVEFANDDAVILSRPYAASMEVSLPAVGGTYCSVFVTSAWLAPGTGGGAGTRPVGRLRGRHNGKRIGFDPKKRNPFA